MSKPTAAVIVLLICLLTCVSPCAAETPAAWTPVDGTLAPRTGAVLLPAPDLKRLLLLGRAEDEAAPFVRAFDPAAGAWSDLSTAAPPAKGFHPYYQAAYDPGTQCVFCLSGGNVLWRFDVAKRAWKARPPAPELDGLSWHTMACDPDGRRLVVVGADKTAGHFGSSRTVVYDISSGKWTRLEVADAQVVQQHRQLAALLAAAIDLAGHARLAWFRDPAGIGTDEDLSALAANCQTIKKMPGAEGFAADVDGVVSLLADKKTLDALKAARRLEREIEKADAARYPVPCARRNSPLAYDAHNKVFVLFGGDHEDYLMNDTWVLDLKRGEKGGVKQAAWKRMHLRLAPSPRAGHALVPLPGGGVALYEGYVQNASTDYGAAPYRPLDPIQLWRYDPRANRWDLLGCWPLAGRKETDRLPPVGHFYGYSSQYYSPPALAADFDGRLVLAAQPGRVWFRPWKDFPARTWTLRIDAGKPDAEGRCKLGTPPNRRLSRGGAFEAAYCEVPERPKDTGLDRLPENRWVRLPAAPRNPCSGCRQRDWGTAVWDSDRDQVLLWGGGHCVRSASTVAHWSPASGRIVEGFDADEPYGANGGGGFDSSLLGRPWISTHNYNHYAYDPKCRLMVSGRGYLYDPEGMDWLRQPPYALPYEFQWGHTVVETSPHGAVAWAQRKGSDRAGLWLFDRRRGWVDLKPRGDLFLPYCDAQGMVYDSKRDRMILSGAGGGYNKLSNGTLLAFDFRTRSIAVLSHHNAELSKTRNAREMAYDEQADCVLIGDMAHGGDGKTARLTTRVYDCAKNRMLLLDAGGFGDGRDASWVGYSTGWMYDAKRKLVYVFTIRGEAWALRLNLQTATP